MYKLGIKKYFKIRFYFISFHFISTGNRQSFRTTWEGGPHCYFFFYILFFITLFYFISYFIYLFILFYFITLVYYIFFFFFFFQQFYILHFHFSFI